MLRLSSVIILCWLFCGGPTAGNQTETREKVYYKQTVSTAAPNGTESLSNETIPIVVEGQPAISAKYTSKEAISLEEIKKKNRKTVPRKGAVDKSSENTYQNDTLSLQPLKMKSTVETNISNTSNVHINSDLQKPSTSTARSIAFHVAPVRELLPKEETSIINATKPIRKPKPKPEVTVGGKEADGPIPASPTKTSPLSIPRKIDYIVPVVITVTALPLLGVAFFILYKRGKDYWSKRHYRRMDFLIDGMYNE